jgi:uncharacterized protein (TIGR02145 family)
MKSNLTKFALSAALVLAITLTLSCSGDNDDNNGGSSSPSSSPSGGDSSPSGGTSGGSSSPSGSSPSSGTSCKLVDTRDSKSYKCTKIGTQTWMAENLSYNATGSKCYGEGELKIIGFDDDYNRIEAPKYTPAEIQDYCNKYGRLYNYETAKEAACPSGWRLPSSTDWDKLVNFVCDAENLVECGMYTSYLFYLQDSWNSYSNDKYGFSALRGGYGEYEDGYYGYTEAYDSFYDSGSGVWWSSTDRSLNDEYQMFFFLIGNMNTGCYKNGNRAKNNCLSSIRCIQN